MARSNGGSVPASIGRSARALRAGASSSCRSAHQTRCLRARRRSLRLLRLTGDQPRPRRFLVVAVACTSGRTSSRRAAGAITSRPTAASPTSAGPCGTHRSSPSVRPGGFWGRGEPTRPGFRISSTTPVVPDGQRGSSPMSASRCPPSEPTGEGRTSLRDFGTVALCRPSRLWAGSSCCPFDLRRDRSVRLHALMGARPQVPTWVVVVGGADLDRWHRSRGGCHGSSLFVRGVAAVPAGDAFSAGQVDAIERAIAHAHSESDLLYSVFVGAPEGDLREQGRRLLGATRRRCRSVGDRRCRPRTSTPRDLDRSDRCTVSRRSGDGPRRDVHDVIVRRGRSGRRHRGRTSHAE